MNTFKLANHHANDPLSGLPEDQAALFLEAAAVLTHQLPARRVAKQNLAIIKQRIAMEAAETRANHARWAAIVATGIAACLAVLLLMKPSSASKNQAEGGDSVIVQRDAHSASSENAGNDTPQPGTGSSDRQKPTPTNSRTKPRSIARSKPTNGSRQGNPTGGPALKTGQSPTDRVATATAGHFHPHAVLPTLGKLLVVELKMPSSIAVADPTQDTAAMAAEKALALLGTSPPPPEEGQGSLMPSVAPLLSSGAVAPEDLSGEPPAQRAVEPDPPAPEPVVADPVTTDPEPPPPPPAEPQIFLTYDPNTDQGALIVDSLPVLDPDQSYHFWARDAVTGQFLRLGILPVTDAAATPIPYSIKKVLSSPDGFVITKEQTTTPVQPSQDVIGQWLAPQP